MAEQAASPSESAFRMPANMHEFGALVLALIAVFVLVQVGAPIIREFEFLDQKLRDYFIGISFAAFPFIHHQCRRSLAGFKPQTTVRHDLAPWFVTGVIAAALLFAWNQFVSFLTGYSMGLALGSLAQNVNIESTEAANALIISIMAVSIPLSAVAAIFAGVMLNRNTRSHTFAALVVASVFFVVFNAVTNWILEPAMVVAGWTEAAAQGALGIAAFLTGLFLVGLIIFVFGTIGVVISRFKRERTIGRLMELARRLPADQRESLAMEIATRLEGKARARASASPSMQSFSSAQVATAVEP